MVRRSIVFALSATAACVLVPGCRGDVQSPGPPPSFHRILFLGNSLTLHPPSPSIGWTGNWGMAASAAVNDYAHVVTTRIPGAVLEAVNISALETDPAQFDPASIDSSLARSPDLVVVELGDNATDASAFQSAYAALITHIAAGGTATILCTSTWWHSPPIDRVIRETSIAAGALYADIGALYADPVNRASAERSFQDPGIGIHPGDAGMKHIADVLLLVLTRSSRAAP
jgi:hypothetical protein